MYILIKNIISQCERQKHFLLYLFIIFFFDEIDLFFIVNCQF